MRVCLSLLLALAVGCGKKTTEPDVGGVGGGGAAGLAPDTASADKAEALNRLKKIGIALHNYESAMQSFPAGIVTKGNAVGLSWRVQLLPYLEEDVLYKQLKLDEPWDSEHNKAFVEKMPAVFASPGKAAPAGHTHLRTFAGMYGFINTPPPGMKNMQLPPPSPFGSAVRGRGMNSITDGTSNTLAVVEAAEPVVWTKPEELSAQPPAKGPFTADAVPIPKLGGPLPGGFHALMADGKAVFFPDTLSPAAIRAMMTPNAGEILPPDAMAVLYPPKPKAIAPPTAAPDAPRMAAVRNLNGIVLAAHEYHDRMGTLPAGIVGPNKQIGLSWRVELLPHLGHKELYAQFKLEEAWDSEHNKKLLDKMPGVFASTGKPAPPGMTFLRTTQGPSGLIPNWQAANALPGKPFRGRGLHGITDGTSNTALVVEAADAVPWTKPDEVNVAGSALDKGEPRVPKLGGVFDGGFHAGLCDGTVVFVKDTLPPRDVFALLTPAGGEFANLDGHLAYSIVPPPAVKTAPKTMTKP